MVGSDALSCVQFFRSASMVRTSCLENTFIKIKTITDSGESQKKSKVGVSGNKSTGTAFGT